MLLDSLAGDLLDQRGEDLPVIADDTKRRVLEDRRLGIGVDCENRPRLSATRHVLACSGNPHGDLQIGADTLAAQPDLARLRNPAQITRDTARADSSADSGREL